MTNSMAPASSFIPSSHTPSDTPIIDISIPLDHGMITWPEDPPVEIATVIDVQQGDPATVRKLVMGSHTGTHVDAFSHFKPKGLTLDQMDLAQYVGSVQVIEVPDVGMINEAVCRGLDLHGASRIIFKTRNSRQTPPWYTQPFNEDYVALSPDGAQYLVNQGVKLIGVDYLSIDAYANRHTVPVHHCLMDAGVYIVEGLYLGHVRPGAYSMSCLPLSIAHGDGAPARVILQLP